MENIYIWHNDAWRQRSRFGARLPHAILLHGPEGTGIEEFALRWVERLLCEAPAGDRACGTCPSCTWLSLGNHPDFRLVQPDSLAAAREDAPAESGREPRSNQIRIDQVRELQSFLSVGTHRGGLRAVVLHPAETMNTATQNALLKALEEPAEASLFLLVSAQPHRLIPTVRSRCHVMALPRPDRRVALEWLAAQGVEGAEAALDLAGGAPLAARELAARGQTLAVLLDGLGSRALDPIALSAACQSMPAAALVAAIYRWAYDLLSLRLGGGVRYHRSREANLAGIARHCRPERLAAYLRALCRARALAQHPLNARLFIEGLLVAYLQAVAAPGGAGTATGG